MKNDLDEKVAIVLGASSIGGMGDAIARRLAREGAKVVVSGRRPEPLHNLAKDIGGAALPADITREEDVKALVGFAVQSYGKLDIAINCTGNAVAMMIDDQTEDHLLAMTRLHHFGPVYFVKHVARAIVDYGAIVNVSSHTAYDTMTGISAYASAKAAGDRFIRAAAVEYSARRLRINGIIPSQVLTALSLDGMRQMGMNADAWMKAVNDLTPLGRTATPDDIAAIAYMMVRDEFFETGQMWNYSGGISLMGLPRTIPV